jgi:hypothetical protein
MEEPITPTPDPISKKRGSKATIVLTIALILALLAGGFAYWWRNDQAEQQKKADAATITQLETQVKSLMGVSLTETTELTGPSEADKENIIASINSGNTAALESYMASSVHVVIAASEGVFDHTPTEAIADLNYISGAIEPWDFEHDEATLADYASGDYKDYFHDNSVVGVSSDLMVVVFNFDSNGDINEIFMAVSADLL